MALYETEIAWWCTCGRSGVTALMYPDDAAHKLGLLRITHRAERGCALQSEVRQRVPNDRAQKPG